MPSESILMLTPLSRFYSLRRDERSVEDFPYVQRPLNRGLRISSDIQPFDSRFVTVENVIRDAVIFTEHRRMKTVTAMDVVRGKLCKLRSPRSPELTLFLDSHTALKRQGRTLYGFGG